MKKNRVGKTIKIFFSIYAFILLNILNIKSFAVDSSSFADGTKDLTGILFSIFIAIGIVLIILCIAIIVKINTLKKAADSINKYISMYGMPKDM